MVHYPFVFARFHRMMMPVLICLNGAKKQNHGFNLAFDQSINLVIVL